MHLYLSILMCFPTPFVNWDRSEGKETGRSFCRAGGSMPGRGIWNSPCSWCCSLFFSLSLSVARCWTLATWHVQTRKQQELIKSACVDQDHYQPRQGASAAFSVSSLHPSECPTLALAAGETREGSEPMRSTRRGRKKMGPWIHDHPLLVANGEGPRETLTGPWARSWVGRSPPGSCLLLRRRTILSANDCRRLPSLGLGPRQIPRWHDEGRSIGRIRAADTSLTGSYSIFVNLSIVLGCARHQGAKKILRIYDNICHPPPSRA